VEDTFGVKGLVDTSKEAKEYLKSHENACNWAKANRELIMQRFLNCLTEEEIEQEEVASVRKILDIWHNNVVLKKFSDGSEFWLHRKGAAPNDQGPIIIPGSRGDYSYLVVGIEENLERSCYSVAHGAGRKWKRSKAQEVRKKSLTFQDWKE
jgi:release factor H-coupled RctB family protein